MKIATTAAAAFRRMQSGDHNPGIVETSIYTLLYAEPSMFYLPRFFSLMKKDETSARA